eukprot:Skav229570  [mRNA]  locus=scaffold568:670992:672521:+ [translate_table: standard]
MSPEVLRTTSPGQALLCGGRAFWSSGIKDYFARSRPTQCIGTFWSHSWHGKTRTKILLLLLSYNGSAAILFGSLAAVIMCALSSCGLLPLYSKAALIRREEEPMYYDMAPWAFSAGCVVSILCFFLWPAPGSIFFDRICIHQLDQELKAKGILSIGGFIKHSQNMMVVWDTTYVERLWCVFELAAFLKSQGPSKELRVRPTFLAPCTLAVYTTFVIGCSFQFAVTDASLVPRIGYGLLFLLAFAGSGHALRCHQRSIQRMLVQLDAFSVVKTESQCCTLGHKDPDSGAVLICDRDVLMKCIVEWFGSTENFDKEVQSKVRTALAKGLGNGSMPYLWSIAAVAPLVWTQLDAIAARLLVGEVLFAAHQALYALAACFGMVPVVLPFSAMLTKRFQSRRAWLICDLGVTLGLAALVILLVVLLYQCFEWANVLPIPLLGASIYTCLLSGIGFFTWRCQKQMDGTVEHRAVTDQCPAGHQAFEAYGGPSIYGRSSDDDGDYDSNRDIDRNHQ